MTNRDDSELMRAFGSVSKQEPVVTPQAVESFQDAALIGEKKLRSRGFFVSAVRLPSLIVLAIRCWC